MLVFQHFQLPLYFILHKNGGSKVKVAYCCLVIYELNSMSVPDYHLTCGRQFLAWLGFALVPMPLLGTELLVGSKEEDESNKEEYW